MTTPIITVPNRVDGSGGLPVLTRVGNPEGTLGDGAGWEAFSATDYLTGFRLWDAAELPNASDFRTLIIRWKHKPGAPASSGDDEYLISRPASAPTMYGGMDVHLRAPRRPHRPAADRCTEARLAADVPLRRQPRRAPPRRPRDVPRAGRRGRGHHPPVGQLSPDRTRTARPGVPFRTEARSATTTTERRMAQRGPGPGPGLARSR